MKNDYATTMKYLLLHTIKSCIPVIRQVFTRRPGRDLTRNSKMNLTSLIYFLIRSGGSTIDSELLKYFHFKTDAVVSRSAFYQQRQKLYPDALLFLLSEYAHALPSPKKYKGKYTLIGIDGSDINIPYNPRQTATWNPPDKEHKRGFNSMHLNALINLSNLAYEDAVIGYGQKGKDERDAFYTMVDRYPSDLMPNTIFIADRGYSGYNSFAHVIENGGRFLIRVKDKDAVKGILKGLQLPDDKEFDVMRSRFLVKRTFTKIMKLQDNVYHYIHKDIRFDYLDKNKNPGLYFIQLRVTRVKISENEYECLVSNLPMYEFSVEDLKYLYHARWNIETSFRALKYNIGMLAFHSKSIDYLLQEIYAGMILYNFCQSIARHIVIKRKGKKYASYTINFSTAITVCREFLDGKATLSGTDLCRLLVRYIHEIKPDRHYKRHIRAQSAQTFVNRIS